MSEKTNYWKPFSEDMAKLAKGAINLIAGPKKEPSKPLDPYFDEKKANEPASGPYEHNSPAKPL